MAQISYKNDNIIKLLPHEELFSMDIIPVLRYSQKSATRALCRLGNVNSISDIGKGGPVLAALPDTGSGEHEGQGLYEAFFGRDSLRVAMDLMTDYPLLAKITIIELAKLQGINNNKASEEEPGRIIHESRSANDPIALKLTIEKGWKWPYYGSVDATIAYVKAIALYCSLYGYQLLNYRYRSKDGRPTTIKHSFVLAVEWITARMDTNPEGLIEYKSSQPNGLANQAWRDSWDAYHHSDGAMANTDSGISSFDVQVSTYDALLDAAHIYDSVLNNKTMANELRTRADRIKSSILHRYWCNNSGGYFVLGTDRDKSGRLRRLKVKTSNMGHIFNSRLLLESKDDDIYIKQQIFNQIKSPELLSPAGIRTLATDEIRFRAGSYHNGSVWPWDTHYIANGLRMHGIAHFNAFADDLDSRLLRAVRTTGGFPEFYKGGDLLEINDKVIVVWDSTAKRSNTIEQPPQAVQAWTASAIYDIKRRLNSPKYSPIFTETAN